jgi:hypothetical protein
MATDKTLIEVLDEVDTAIASEDAYAETAREKSAREAIEKLDETHRRLVALAQERGIPAAVLQAGKCTVVGMKDDTLRIESPGLAPIVVREYGAYTFRVVVVDRALDEWEGQWYVAEAMTSDLRSAAEALAVARRNWPEWDAACQVVQLKNAQNAAKRERLEAVAAWVAGVEREAGKRDEMRQAEAKRLCLEWGRARFDDVPLELGAIAEYGWAPDGLHVQPALIFRIPGYRTIAALARDLGPIMFEVQPGVWRPTGHTLLSAGWSAVLSGAKEKAEDKSPSDVLLQALRAWVSDYVGVGEE